MRRRWRVYSEFVEMRLSEERRKEVLCVSVVKNKVNAASADSSCLNAPMESESRLFTVAK